MLKELNESKSWLEQIVANGLFSHDKMATLIAENQELCWIVAASVKTARGAVQFETSDFGFEVQDLSNFRFFRALDESSMLMPPEGRGQTLTRRSAPTSPKGRGI